MARRESRKQRVPPGALPDDPTAHARLAAALLDLAKAGESLPCAGSPLPTSEVLDKRRVVTQVFCPRCRIRELCAAAGKHEPWGVWGGIDRERKSTNVRRKDTA